MLTAQRKVNYSIFKDGFVQPRFIADEQNLNQEENYGTFEEVHVQINDQDD